jgi:excinuclease ABC subunit C
MSKDTPNKKRAKPSPKTKNVDSDGGVDTSSIDACFDSKAFLKTLTGKPGIYRMLDGDNKVLYVGKARNLKKRVASYFSRSKLGPKTQAMVAQVRDVEVTVTHLSENDEYARISYHRGAKRAKGRYFGPYPSAGAVRESLNLLQKLFRVRQCEDNFFRNRTRPCLQYQIQRCTAPCVEVVSKQDYEQDVRHTVMFLEGKSPKVIDELVKRMEKASNEQDFEEAAHFRDQIASLRRVQESQYVSGEGGDLDVIAAVLEGGLACVQVFFIRGGRNLGNKVFYPQHVEDAQPGDVLAAFIPQFYLSASSGGNGNGSGRTIPSEILLNQPPEEVDLLQSVLSEESGHRVRIAFRLRGERKKWLEMATANAETAVRAHLASKANLLHRFETLQDKLGLDSLPQRLECFDISHTMGEATVASCVVMDTTGPVKSDYRRFNIEGITPGDDYAAMRQAISRRYTRLKKGEAKLPDILFIDGGKGQLAEAEKVMEELQINGVILVGIAKGPGRKPGEEALFLSGQKVASILPADSPALHLIQQIRDEAHRFAITGHRQRRAKARNTSVLEDVPGLGPKRRQNLLKQFGGLQEVARAGVDDLSSIPGISKQLAQRVYDVFHSDE